MTAFPLFDRFADGPQDRLMTVATTMVSAAIQQFETVTEFDEGLAPAADVEDAPFDMETALVLRRMYEECTKEAERVLARIDRIERSSGVKVPGSDSLRDWHGKTMAMLSVPVDEIARGIEEARKGQLIPVGVIRDELRNRLHT